MINAGLGVTAIAGAQGCILATFEVRLAGLTENEGPDWCSVVNDRATNRIIGDEQDFTSADTRCTS